MPPLETMDRHQKACLWVRAGTNSLGQDYVANPPVEIMVMWDDRQTRALDSQGNTITVDVMADVAQDIEIGSIMWLGRMADLPYPSHTPASGLMQVKTFSKTLDIKGRNARREVGLMRFTNTLPLS
jgi:hypothetical protein